MPRTHFLGILSDLNCREEAPTKRPVRPSACPGPAGLSERGELSAGNFCPVLWEGSLCVCRLWHKPRVT